LSIESELDLALLPGAQARRADEDGDRCAVANGTFQSGQPRLAGGKLITIEESGEAGLLQIGLDLPHRWRICTTVAQEDVD
jgi:hypothetical protein